MTRTGRRTLGMAILMTAMAMPAAAQYSAPKLTTGVVGEQYHIQVAGGFWLTNVSGVVSSEQFGQIGSRIDFLTDLHFERKTITDVRFEVKASKRNKLYAMYTPISFSSDTTLARDITFNGVTYPANFPIQASVDWKVWRLGYELDVISVSRGFIGIMIEGRLTDFGATLKAPGADEFIKARGPLPAVGGIARAYVLPNLSITGSFTGFKSPAALKPNLEGHYTDWEIYGTYNLNRYVGFQAGYRNMPTTVTIKKDFGDMDYKGMWFGAVVRY